MKSADGYKFREFYIPEHMSQGVDAWVLNGIPPGSFLRAVLENDLARAVGCADSENLRNLPAYVAFLHNEAPSACWGSPEKVAEWEQSHRESQRCKVQ